VGHPKAAVSAAYSADLSAYFPAPVVCITATRAEPGTSRAGLVGPEISASATTPLVKHACATPNGDRRMRKPSSSRHSGQRWAVYESRQKRRTQPPSSFRGHLRGLFGPFHPARRANHRNVKHRNQRAFQNSVAHKAAGYHC
jgi:hypothetical protein